MSIPRPQSQANGPMPTATRATLLARIKNPRDTQAWSQFYKLYGPLLYKYARARGLSREDAEDVRSTCYEAVVKQMPGFEYDKAKGGFKAWLRTLVQRRVADLLRKRRELRADSEVLRAAPTDEPAPDETWERVWRHQHLRYCVEQVRGKVSQQTFQAFWMLVMEERPGPEVAELLGMNQNQIYKAKARVMGHVREKLSEVGAE